MTPATVRDLWGARKRASGWAASSATLTWKITWASVGVFVVAGAVVLVGLALRLDGLGWGRPFVYHPDEWAIANPAMDMVRAGSWDPNEFTYPSGLIYAERLIVAALHHLDPSVSLETSRSVVFPEQFPYIYAGRLLVATLGALTAVPVFLAARSVSNLAGGLTAAFAIAVAPVAVLNSHYLTTDVPTAAMTALVLWLSLRGLAGGRRWLVAAGLAAGFAASMKYNGGLVVIVPLVALLTSASPRQVLRRPQITTAVLVGLASMAGFVMLTPAVLFDPHGVWERGIVFQAQMYSGGFVLPHTSNDMFHYLRVLSGNGGLGSGLFLLAGIGAVLAAAGRRRADLTILSFVVAYYALISLPPIRFDRNLLPLMPFLAVLVGRAVGCAVELFATRPRSTTAHRVRPPSVVVQGAIMGLVVMLAVPSVSAVAAQNQAFHAPDTRAIALDWIERNIQPGAKIAREWSTPQVPTADYDVAFMTPLASKPLDWYRSRGFDYLITSSPQLVRYAGHQPEDASTRHSSRNQ